MIRRRAIGLAAAALLALGASDARLPANPIFPGADPDAITVGGETFIYPTGRGDRLDAWASRDMVHWRDRGVVLRRAAISWIATDGASVHQLWAPDVLHANGRYYLYYAVGPQNPTPSRIGVAVGAKPTGPFRDTGAPLLTGGNGFEAIDPMVFVDPASRTPYLYAGGSAGSTLRVYQLTPDLLHIARQVTVDQPPNFTEGVFLHVRNGIYYLSYSHGHWDRDDYSVHYATAPSPIGPWTYRGVILASDGVHHGPGHHSIIRDPRSGDWLIVYHRWEGVSGPGPYHGERQVAIDRLRYRPDGTIEPVRMTGR